MKKILLILPVCMMTLGCTKSKNSHGGGGGGGGKASPFTTTSAVNLKVGGKTYNTTDYTYYNGAATNYYQWDGLNLYNDFPPIYATATGDYYQVAVWDTAGGVMASQELLLFDVPALKNFDAYFSPLAEIFLQDTIYVGTATVSGTITGNGNHTGNGSFNLQGMVASEYNATDSVPFTATITFTNVPQ